MDKRKIDLITIIAGFTVSGVSLAIGAINLCKYMKKKDSCPCDECQEEFDAEETCTDEAAE